MWGGGLLLQWFHTIWGKALLMKRVSEIGEMLKTIFYFHGIKSSAKS